jgi:hypothetical protein
MAAYDDDFDEALTDAIQRDPLAPPPPTLSPAIMTRIQGLAPARFRIRPLDWMLSAFVTGMLGLAALIWQLLTPQQLAYLQLEYLKVSHRISPTTLGLIGAAGVLLVAAALVTALTVFARAHSSPR